MAPATAKAFQDGQWKDAEPAPVEKSQQELKEEALRYVQEICSFLQYDYWSLPLNQIVLHGNNRVITDKNELNKNLFAFVNGMGQSKRRPELDDKIRAATEVYKSLYSNRQKTEIQELFDKAIGYYHEFEQSLQQATDKNRVFMLAKRAFPKLGQSIDAIEQSGFWRLEDIHGDLLTFVTVNNIFLTEFNRGAGIDLRVDMGKFKVTLEIIKGRLRIYPLAGNLYVNGHYHCYVSSSGAMCWGEAAYRAADNIRNMNVKGVMDLLQAGLSHYGTGNPYVNLYEFHERSKSGERTTADEGEEYEEEHSDEDYDDDGGYQDEE